MSIFDLLFLALVLASAVTLVVAAGCFLFGRRARAARILRAFLIGAAIYFAVVLIVSPLAPRRELKTGQPLCYDDWCITIESVDSRPTAPNVTYDVSLRISSRARGRTQRENNLAVYLIDDGGRRYDPVPQPSDIAFNVAVDPGQSIVVTRRFQIPREAREPGVIIAHEGGFPISWFIIGEGPFHKQPMMKLPAPAQPRSGDSA